MTGVQTCALPISFDAFAVKLAAFVPDTNYLAALDTAISKYEQDLNPQSVIDDAVDNFDNRQRLIFNRAVGSVVGQFAMANAVVGSSFPQALALLAADHLSNVADFRAKASLQAATERLQTVLGFSDNLVKLQLDNIDRAQQATQLQGEINRVAIVAGKERADVDATIAVKSALWELELYQYPSNFISAIQGGNQGGAVPPMHGGSSAIGGAIGGAASGAIAGAQIGSAVPGIGTMYGAIGGAVIGGIGGYMSSS